MKRPTKVVFPLAGLRIGPRSATMAGRVELMPVVDKPLIQYAIEEAASAGFTEMIFVTGPSPQAGRVPADGTLDLEVALELRGKTELLDAMRDFVPRGANCVLIRQPESLGIAHAIACAKPLLAGEPFAVVLADELFSGGTCALGRMVEHFENCRCSIVGAQRLEPGEPTPHGVLRCAAQLDSLYQIAHVADAPRASDSCTALGVVGRHVFAPGIMSALEPLAGRPARLVEAIARLLRRESVLAYRIEGERYDCGSKLGYLKAMLAFGLVHPEIGDELARHVESLARGIQPCVPSSALSPSAT